eukprot:TRINITY_DN16611_c0_g1_i2.p2 TRINITY_DN16611_c0_g1~~TRINITY_DN16611_c0_g1_i2.p2  ORF type:complete len:124 (+),score=38.99 TRINITY_DN16611_c0_g1_i2:346-717(+)
MQQVCRNEATMANGVTVTGEAQPEGQGARSRIWTFAAPEYYTLALILSVGIATYIFVTGDAQSERLLTPGLVAVIMVVNLVPAMALIVLIGSRVARARDALDGEIGRAVQQECRDRSRMPSSA